LVRNITEVKRAEERLRTSEERLRLALEAAGLGVFEYDVLRDDSMCSPPLKAMHGLDSDGPVILAEIIEQIHPDDRARVLAPIERARATGELDDFFEEIRITRRDGSPRWLAIKGSLLSGPARGDRNPRIIGVVQDITERKLAEERLRQSEERLRTSEQRLQRAQELGGVASFEWNQATDETWVSESYREIFGLSPTARLGVALFNDRLHPDDRERVIARLTQIPDNVDTIDIEYRVIRPNDRQERWIYSTMGVLRDPATGTIRLAGIALDITERKQVELALATSEERLRLAQELGEIGSYDWSIRHEAVYVSDMFRQILGISAEWPLPRERFWSLVWPQDVDYLRAAFEAAIAESKDFDVEYRMIRPLDKKLRWIHSRGGVVRDAGGRAARLVGIISDITERKRHEERERLLSREVDHRAKNLLSVVQAMVQLTHAPSIPAFVEQVKGRIHALGRAHSLLAASRWSGAELAQLIEEELAPFADDAGRVRIAGPAIALRPAAAQSMALMIHELTTNAAKYGALSSPAGQVEVRWEVAPGPGELRLYWRERGGPPVTPPTRFGFGLTHIRGSVEHQLGGTLDLSWPAEGLMCELALPSRQLVLD
jgi:PAS domain S-box-containing protein